VVHPAIIETYEDHRMAMAFALIGLRADGVKIANPNCCAKTFENYFELIDEITK
jgi:3-phosphoshikimate 1-carboxyvinyltransferase